MMNEVYIYKYNLRDDGWSAEDESVLQSLPKSEQAICEKYKFMIDKKLSVYSKYYLRMHLSELTGISFRKLAFYRNSYGKPFLQNDENIYFNVSHTRNKLLIGVSIGVPIGVDVERMATPPYEIMDNCFTIEEIRYIETRKTPEEKQSAFFSIWTRKEAYTKMTGTGLNTSLKDIDTTNLTDNVTICTKIDDMYVESVAVPGSISAFTCL